MKVVDKLKLDDWYGTLCVRPQAAATSANILAYILAGGYSRSHSAQSSGAMAALTCVKFPAVWLWRPAFSDAGLDKGVDVPASRPRFQRANVIGTHPVPSPGSSSPPTSAPFFPGAGRRTKMRGSLLLLRYSCRAKHLW